jgi:hypothetical protein
MTKKTYTYSGISFKQNPKAPELFAFVAPAEELVEFCGVARKSEKLLTNYQRALDTVRVNTEVMPFFRIPENCTPTAVVISLHETPLAELKFVDLIDNEGAGLNLKRLSLTLTDPNSLDASTVIAEARKLLDARLATEPLTKTGDAGDQMEVEDSVASDQSDAGSGDEGDDESAETIGQEGD